jgi:hypothetical protein
MKQIFGICNPVLTQSILLSFLCICASICNAQSLHEIKPLNPPDMQFYAKEIDYEGIAIKAPLVVADAALVEARRRLAMMLHSLPDVIANLSSEGAELHIIGKNQGTSDLPEHRHEKSKFYKGKMSMDERTRGVGGIYASCGEENLLGLPGDRYAGRDICAHEFAHTVMEFGFDDDLRKRITDQYRRSLERGLWKSMYAARDEKEFFAELTMWYFGTRGDYGSISPPPSPGKEWFKNYDPESYRLLDDIYSGRISVARIRLQVIESLPRASEATLKSISGQYPTTLRFVNLTDHPVLLYWLDYRGRRKPYGEILEYERVRQQTFATHPFLFTDKSGNVLSIFVAVREPGIAYLRP